MNTSYRSNWITEGGRNDAAREHAQRFAAAAGFAEDDSDRTENRSDAR